MLLISSFFIEGVKTVFFLECFICVRSSVLMVVVMKLGDVSLRLVMIITDVLYVL